MDLTFNKDGGSFVAEFVTTADFNLHIEKSGGDFRIMQKTTENGKYDSIDGLYIPAGNPVIDYDFVASIYPKYIKIVSEVEPTLAVVTSAGEVTEIKPEVPIDESLNVYFSGYDEISGWEVGATVNIGNPVRLINTSGVGAYDANYNGFVNLVFNEYASETYGAVYMGITTKIPNLRLVSQSGVETPLSSYDPATGLYSAYENSRFSGTLEDSTGKILFYIAYWE